MSNSATTSRGFRRLPSALSRSTQRASVCSSVRSSSITASMPGRSTLTATSRPSFSVAKCTCAIEALATGSASKLAKSSSMGLPKAFSTSARGLGRRERRHAVLQLGQFVGQVQRQQVAPRRQHLAELDEDRPQPLQRQAQAHAARLRRSAGRA